MLFFLIFFFRHKNVNLQNKQNYFISPSNSKIIKIKTYKNFNIINTYLSLLNHHFMIAPCDCIVIDIIKNPDKNYKHNIPIINNIINKNKIFISERLIVIFKDTNNHYFVLEQIVNKFAREAWLPSLLYSNRCVVFVKKGCKLKQGEKYGLIRFGSNMKYIIPKYYKLLINEGDMIEIGQEICKK